MDACEFSIYDGICQSLISSCPVKAMIYLRCDPKICHQRIKKRNREGEQSIPLEYLQKVHDRHEEWVNRQKNLKVLNIDTGAYDFENPEQLGQLLVAIKQFIE